MADFVRRVCGGAADTHAGILTGDRYGYRASAVCGQTPPQLSRTSRELFQSPTGGGGGLVDVRSAKSAAQSPQQVAL